jgi:hypothetical protein
MKKQLFFKNNMKHVSALHVKNSESFNIKHVVAIVAIVFKMIK